MRYRIWTRYALSRSIDIPSREVWYSDLSNSSNMDGRVQDFYSAISLIFNLFSVPSNALLATAQADDLGIRRMLCCRRSTTLSHWSGSPSPLSFKLLHIEHNLIRRVRAVLVAHVRCVSFEGTWTGLVAILLKGKPREKDRATCRSDEPYW